jgi:hypothetical protein
MKGNIMNNEQLELGLTQQVLRITVRRKQAMRARWWFEHMRRVVDSATDWQTGTPARPEQIQLLSGRGTSIA